MAQRDGYQINGARDAKEYAFRGAPGERRAYSSAYADARSDNNRKYMSNVARGGRNYDASRLSKDADAEDSRIYRLKNKRESVKRKASKQRTKSSGRR